jgi:hypothetical protein
VKSTPIVQFHSVLSDIFPFNVKVQFFFLKGGLRTTKVDSRRKTSRECKTWIKTPGVNFINILFERFCTKVLFSIDVYASLVQAFTLADPKSAKNTVKLVSIVFLNLNV